MSGAATVPLQGTRRLPGGLGVIVLSKAQCGFPGNLNKAVRCCAGAASSARPGTSTECRKGAGRRHAGKPRLGHLEALAWWTTCSAKFGISPAISAFGHFVGHLQVCLIGKLLSATYVQHLCNRVEELQKSIEIVW